MMESKCPSSYIGNKRPMKGLKRACWECKNATEIIVSSIRPDTNFKLKAKKERFMETRVKRTSVSTPA
jgi:hypothetical protein